MNGSICQICIPGGTVVNDEHVNRAGLGIQLPLMWHVTWRTRSSVVILMSFSQVSVNIAPSRVELLL